VYTCDCLTIEEFEKRFAQFQGQNSNVEVEYVVSDFIRKSDDEMATLEAIFQREAQSQATIDKIDSRTVRFNVIVDLCGIFKLSTIHDIRDLVKKHFGADRFDYIYHIDQTDNSDRVLCTTSDNDVQYDEEFYNFMCKKHGAGMNDRIFFFIDNRNVVGKDVPFQLVFQRHYGRPLFTKSLVLAHDMDDFSKIWQAMGRSRTMNDTVFSIYKSDIPSELATAGAKVQDIKKHALSRYLYVRNCDCKMAGNISSVYLTLIALYNLSQQSFYYCDEIVNTFLEKMENTIALKVTAHENLLAGTILLSSVPARILLHIFADKFKKSSNSVVSNYQLTPAKVNQILRQVVRQKFEQRDRSGDHFDDLVVFLSGEQQSLMEISYTKQQQKQKQQQQNKNQDSDTMGIFDKKNQLELSYQTEDYFESTLDSSNDVGKLSLNLTTTVPIFSLSYVADGKRRMINVYPTLQFLYSHHIRGEYLSNDVQKSFLNYKRQSATQFFANFIAAVTTKHVPGNLESETRPGLLDVKVHYSFIRQNPQYAIAGIEEGVYIIGMKDQFNAHDLKSHPLQDRIHYVADETGFVLFDKSTKRNVDCFGPYFIEQYILMEALSKSEVAANVIEYYSNCKEILQRSLDGYDETQGKGFICWRFLFQETSKGIAAQETDIHHNDNDTVCSKRSTSSFDSDDDNPDGNGSSFKRRRSENGNDGKVMDADDVTAGFATFLDI
jgi:hypothetical protein